jgi:hypothetical protein
MPLLGSGKSHNVEAQHFFLPKTFRLYQTFHLTEVPLGKTIEFSSLAQEELKYKRKKYIKMLIDRCDWLE